MATIADELGQHTLDVLMDTILSGDIGIILADSIQEDLDTLVPDHMPGGFLDGLATHLNAWLANVLQRRDRDQTRYLQGLIEMLVMTGDLTYSEEQRRYVLRGK